MATNLSGLPGALYDPDVGNKIGGLNCGIGIGTNSVYGPPVPAGLTLGDGSVIARIGSSPPYGARAEACGYPTKVITLQKAVGAAVAPGAAMPDGSINQTGKPIPVGGACYGVQP